MHVFSVHQYKLNSNVFKFLIVGLFLDNKFDVRDLKFLYLTSNDGEYIKFAEQIPIKDSIECKVMN